ncbi:histidinol-phosphate transaminase [Croceitalea rosinachiae]|uniref:Histidinol-phosphate aminotransferase n=1 Tax=Croceitalea rosinachiae TaxID=3075596 RepID=A0ABU3ABE8_9FLAO|nr:histidinol-phosphate transaminase [Croceitalea sp. F388]MDT0607494.1 histidinol-phosphate transaminase [Croceitalea sp. F388]
MSFNLDNITRESVKELTPYSSARDEYVSDGSDMVFLDANENPFENGVNRYPDPQQRSLKSVLAQQKGIEKDNILLGNGSDEVLDLLFRAFCEPKIDNIITLPPTYGIYKVLSSINDIENREVLLTDEFQPDINAILKGTNSNSKLLFICSPNNPTGNSISINNIEKLLNEFKGLVIIDEAYIDFSAQKSWVSKISKYKNLVIAQTLSKAYGMAGVRLGICIASKEIISVLNKLKPPYNVNELTQNRALERVLNVKKVKSEVTQILSERKRMVKAFSEVSFIAKIFSSEANFVLVQVDDAALRYRQLLDKGIVVRNRSTQPLCKNTLRFTIGTALENDRLLEVLKTLK